MSSKLPFETENNENSNIFHCLPGSCRVVDNSSRVIQQNALFVNQTSTRRKLHENYNNAHSFHSAIKPIIRIGQYFGIFAMDGVKNPTPEMMTFKVKSLRTIYSCGVSLNILILLYCVGFLMINKRKATALSFIPFGIHIGFSFLMHVTFICSSQMWITLQKKWKKVEEILDMYYQHPPQLRVKFQIIIAVIGFIELGDHIVAVTFRSFITNEQLIGFFKMRGKNIVEAFFGSDVTVSDNWLFIMGIYSFGSFCIVSFIRTFTNIFIIFVAIGLTGRYKAVNEHVYDLIKSNCQSINWSRLKIHYEMLSDLVKETDRLISPLILLSIGSNIYFICINLLDGLVPKQEGILNAIHFFGGFVILVIKTIAVILFAARINDESKKPILFLSKCPVQGPAFEAQWLQVQLSIDEVALTAMKFFPITRKFLITVISTIISYEVLLLQFHK